MEQTAYVLLVGIDSYEAPVPALGGCVNDVTAFETLLRERIAVDRFELKARVLRNEEATRQAVVDGFRHHLAKAGEHDVALFYFSGHGSQEPAPAELWHLEPDRLNETLVCYDSRREGVYDLADKELAQLIAEVARNDPHVVAILDCCHAGSGTRDAGDRGVRRTASDGRARPLESYAMTLAQAAALTPGAPLHLPRGRHLVLSACRADEESREATLGGQRRGVFSYYLEEALAHHGGSLTYRDLFKRVNALVRARSATQSPVVESTEPGRLDQRFLGGAIGPRARYFTASFSERDGWTIDGGAVHGIPEPAGGETTHLALFSIECTAEQLTRVAASAGAASVTERLPARSKLSLDFDADRHATYKAVVTATPLPPLGVSLEGDPAGVAEVRRALAGSLLVTEKDAGAELVLSARGGAYRIRRRQEGRPLAVDTESVDEAVQRLEHISRWIRIAELRNPTGALPPDAVRMEITDLGGKPIPQSPDGLRIAYELRRGEWHPPAFKVKLTNTTRRRLYCMLLDLPETFSVFAGLIPGGGEWLGPGEEMWPLGGEPVYASVPDDLWNAGMVELRDLLKLVVSTEECDATLLEQGDLDVALVRAAGRPGAAPRHTLHRLMHRVHTRHFAAAPAGDTIVDWAASEVAVTTVRPRHGVMIPGAGASAELAPGVAVEGHPRLRANARLTTAAQATRGAGATELPPLLLDHPEAVQPLELSAGRGGEAGLAVLELLHVEDHTVVTPDSPLRLILDRSLGESERILPVAREGDLFLPLGHARRRRDELEIRLDRLPAPQPEDARSLTGSVRIYLEKVVVETLGGELRYPLLAAVEHDGRRLQREAGRDEVRARIERAERIVLFVHGIIGDTEAMAESAFAPPGAAVPIAERYDLVLTFDYENLNTPIEDIARSLEERLREVGLAPGHGKTLHVVAHSMGGLVSRWFIERGAGREVVERLVMLGTPNGGTPWSKLQDWATTALGLALNGLSAAAWPVKALGKVVEAIEMIDVTLDQMEPSSALLKEIGASPDPGVAYRIIAGDTKLLAAQEDGKNGRAGLFARIVRRLAPRRLLHGATSLAFFGRPNDIAVSVDSSTSVSCERNPAPGVEVIGCDHLTFFSTETGQRALANALDEGGV